MVLASYRSLFHTQRWPELGRGLPSFRYLLTVRGDTRMPSLRFSSSAIRSSPQVGFSRDHFQNQVPHVLRQSGPPSLARLPSPEHLERLRVPLEERVRLHNHQRCLPFEEL